MHFWRLTSGLRVNRGFTFRTVDESVAQHVIVYAPVSALSVGCGTREALHAVHRWRTFWQKKFCKKIKKNFRNGFFVCFEKRFSYQFVARRIAVDCAHCAASVGSPDRVRFAANWPKNSKKNSKKFKKNFNGFFLNNFFLKKKKFQRFFFWKFFNGFF